jgi:gamma-glutamyl hydrolase
MMDNYVQFLESAGARVVPIIYGNPVEGELAKLDQVNGLVFPGGDAADEYLIWGKQFYTRAKAINDEGTHFPIWGTCQGFEQLAMYESDFGIKVLSTFNATHTVLPLKFLVAPGDTKMFAPLQNEARIFETKDMTFNAHSFGLSLDQFSQSVDKGLTAAFTPISTSIDSDGKVFVSAFESETYPIFGIQFHPEKTIFSWYANANIPHDSTSVYYNRYFADFIVNEAKKNE